MNTTVISLTPTKPFSPSSSQIPSNPQHRPLRSLSLVPIKTRITSINNATSNDGGNASPPPAPITPPDTVEIRFRRGSRRKSRQEQDGVPKKAEQASAAAVTKDWESMTMTEKAIELYMGEKGLLFWINKLAYACIFIVIGAWILFRFVGPALNLYQLDSAPLSPSSIFKS